MTRNNTYIRNPGYTSATTTSATYTHTIKPISSSICQFRLDFDTFVIAGLNTVASVNAGDPELGDCVTDQLTIREVSGYLCVQWLSQFMFNYQGVDRTGAQIFNPPVF